MLHEACLDVIHLINNIRELVGEAEGADQEPNEALFATACNSLIVGVGDLVRQVIQYAEPDAGVEPL